MARTSASSIRPQARTTRNEAPPPWSERQGKAATYKDSRLTFTFGDAGATAVVKVTVQKRTLLFEVESVTGDGVDQLICPHVPLSLKANGEDPFTACVLALNLKTNSPEIPGPSKFLRAYAYGRLGMAGAKSAIVACPTAEFRNVLKEAVTAAPDVPHSPISGPWAPDGPINYGSYLFNFTDLTEETVDDWIACCKRLGVTQIDFHGGRSFRFGDFEPNPKLYPKGKASLKAVIDRLHAAGISAGLHTYSQFLDPKCPYVTPVPHPDLGKLETYTLTAPLDEKATTVPVAESTRDTPTLTGFFIRGSVTLQIDNELITYKAVAKDPPFAFTGCKRGAFGTKVASHAKGAKARRLRGCFNRFVADGESALYTEVAAKTAELYNDCGFDMIYLDALDGSDAVAGREWSWYYGSKFAWAIWKRLKRPALMEMSTFHHHLWYVRARMGAWDHPTRSHKKFVDIHCRANQRWQRSFLPTNLGWWAFKTWHGPQAEPTYPDDIEYLCAKAIANDSSLSIMGINPKTVKTIAVLPRLAAIMRRYENLRNAKYFNDDVKAKLRVPGDEFKLEQGDKGEWQFRRAQYARHKVQGLNGWGNTWKSENRFGRQPVKLRIEALYSAGPYDAKGNITLADFADAKNLPNRGAQKGVTASITPTTEQVKAGGRSGCFKASNSTATPLRAWAWVGKKFDPPLNLSKHQGIGVWVHGDGKGEVLNLQTRSPLHMSRAYGDHYITVDFTGWRYFELIETEGERHADYSWPYGGIYAIYRESVRMNAVEELNLYVNNVPAKGKVTCTLSPIKAIPLVKAKLRNPAITIGGKTIRFPVEIDTGCYLEFRSATDCKLYDPKGKLICDVKPEGDAPVIEAGANAVKFTCESDGAARPRAYVWVITEGETVRGRNPKGKIKWNFLGSEADDPRTITALDGVQNQWDITCRADAKLELEMTVDQIDDKGAAYEAPTAVPVETFDSLDAFADRPENQYAKYVVSGKRKGFPTSPGVTHKLDLCSDGAKVGKSCVRYTATSKNPSGWSARGRPFSPPVDLSTCTDLGFWLYGDGKGETLYLQLRDTAGQWVDAKTKIEFAGWKYVEFPLAGAKADLSKIEYLIIYYNAIPAGATVTCRVDDVRGIRKTLALTSPSITVNGRKLVFPVSLTSGDRLVYSGGACKLFPAGSNEAKVVTPEGPAPTLHPGPNPIQIGLTGPPPKAFQMRVAVTKVYR
ncbi:MAG: hypothetical protein GXP25_11195 [Planctomycetes bacterium]|nr:hypothetical protein [Planctomycetota bacterium]